MRVTSVLALVGWAALSGCFPDHPPAPEEVALDRFDEGQRLFAAEKYADAAIEYEYALQHRPRWTAPYLQLVACHEKLGREDDAISVLERLLRVDGTSEDALRGLGRIYARRGDAAHALEQYRKLRALHPEDPSLDGEIHRLEAMRKP